MTIADTMLAVTMEAARITEPDQSIDSTRKGWYRQRQNGTRAMVIPERLLQLVSDRSAAD